MTATIDTITKYGTTTWQQEWSGVGPYQMYTGGLQIHGDLPAGVDTYNDVSITQRHNDTEEPPALEVLDSTQGETPQNIKHPPRATLQWRGNTSAVRYKIEEKIASVWTLRATVKETGLGYYQYDTEALVDSATANFRVKILDERDYESEPLLFDVFTVRNPAPPLYTATWDSVGVEIDIVARTL